VWLSADLFDWIALPQTIACSLTGINSWTDDGSHPFGSPATPKQRFYRVELVP
jgi:hypothetical protein